MNVRVLVGDIFESDAQTLVNTVNCVGVMGKGLALEFKKQFPKMYRDYVSRCERGQVRLGQPYLYRPLLPPWILNFPTKDHWRSVASLDNITEGLDYLVANYREWGITSLAVPPLGSGNGQLEWRIVGPTLVRYLNQMDIPVELYAPYGTSHQELQPEFLEGTGSAIAMPEPEWIPPAWIALIEVLSRLEDQPLRRPIGRTMFHKLAYVLTLLGLPTGLTFERKGYGPHAAGMKALLTRLANNGLVRERQAGNMIKIEVGPTFSDARSAYEESLCQWNDAIERATDLFERIQDTSEAEILATVLFAANELESSRDDSPSEREIFEDVMEWKARRRPPVDESSVSLMVRGLNSLGWINAQISNDLPIPLEMQVTN